MPHLYRCPLCGTTSDPYTLRSGAERHGAGHRHARHGGDHPYGEHIVTVGYRLPQGREWLAVAVAGFLVMIGLLSKTF